MTYNQASQAYKKAETIGYSEVNNPHEIIQTLFTLILIYIQIFKSKFVCIVRNFKNPIGTIRKISFEFLIKQEIY